MVLPLPREGEDDQRVQQRRREKLLQRYVYGVLLQIYRETCPAFGHVEVGMLENTVKLVVESTFL
jgi:hypothetical protein